jgi:small-conductance mechanosensitive channel
MRNLPSAAGQGKDATATVDHNNIVDLSPWRTAQALAPLAVTAEETQYAREAERLADHEVDQAFAAALRRATIQAQHRTLTGEALALSQKVQQLQQMVAQDQEQVRALSSGSSAKSETPGSSSTTGETDLEIAKAQLGLESDELADATQDLNRVTGDQRAQIQSELSAHEAEMKKYDESREDGQLAVLSARRYGTLAGRIGAFYRQEARIRLINQAAAQTLDNVHSLTGEHNTLEASANALSQPSAGTSQDRAARLASIKDRSAERQLLGIYDDRIQTEQQLAKIYQRWAAQVRLQHRILLHLLVQSIAWIIVILICMLLGDTVVRRLMDYPVLDRRQRHTLRAILELAIQIVGVVLILLVIFGAPQQTTTFIGLATAALTIALQDFVLAFFGWFVLMGNKGIRVGDLVEINGVGGEVVELGLMSTTLLETGSLADKGYPTGRRITFMNSFAIRGQYFNFSTAGQWMWDQITVAVPDSVDTHTAVDRILEAVKNETSENSRLAEQEWKRALRGEDLGRSQAAPAVNLRPSGSGWDADIRYVSRASQRFELRNRLYQIVVDLLKGQATAVPS